MPTIEIQLVDLEDRTLLRYPGGARRGTALIGLPRVAAKAPDGDPLFSAHSLYWESREIIRTFVELGFDVDVIDLGAPLPQGGGPYQASLTLHHQLLMIEAGLAPGAIRINWMTGSNPVVQNAREMMRIRSFEQRRNCRYKPRRQTLHVEAELAAIEKADHCVLIGNRITLDTYPRRWHAKTACFAVSAANVGHIKQPAAFVPAAREFVWFSASGAILKGLDLLLDLFGRYDLPTLHIVGLVDEETDFIAEYKSELESHPRIRRYGFLNGNDPALAAIFDRCVAVLHPSASEGMAGSVAHCLQVGLYPIISRVSGIDLPPGCGRILESCVEEEIAVAIMDVMNAPEADLRNEIAQTQRMALERFSQDSYRRQLRDTLGAWLSRAPAG